MGGGVGYVLLFTSTNWDKLQGEPVFQSSGVRFHFDLDMEAMGRIPFGIEVSIGRIQRATESSGNGVRFEIVATLDFACIEPALTLTTRTVQSLLEAGADTL